MEYEFDVFVSYKRYGEWTTWVQGEFFSLLRDHLSMALGRPAEIFIDNQLEGGTDWPNDLAHKLTTSRILVPLFSKMYFGSEWCLKEFCAFRFKEDQIGLRTAQHPSGIIVPGRIHDGTKDDLPPYLHECCRLQAEPLTDYAITSLKRTSLKFENFEETVKLWIDRSIKPAIDRTRGKQPDDAWLSCISEQKFTYLSPANFDKPDFPSLA